MGRPMPPIRNPVCPHWGCSPGGEGEGSLARFSWAPTRTAAERPEASNQNSLSLSFELRKMGRIITPDPGKGRPCRLEIAEHETHPGVYPHMDTIICFQTDSSTTRGTDFRAVGLALTQAQRPKSRDQPLSEPAVFIRVYTAFAVWNQPCSDKRKIERMYS